MYFVNHLLASCILLCTRLAASKRVHFDQVSTEGCYVGEWGTWGPCTRNTPCPSSLSAFSDWSFDLPLDNSTDEEPLMTRSMALKTRQWQEERDCRESGKCPQLRMRHSERDLPCVSGSAGIYPCWNIDLLAFVDFENLGSSGGNGIIANDIWGWTDPENGEEYVLIGLSDGTSFVRITDAREPQVIGFLPTRTVVSSWRDVKVLGNTAYIVSEASNHGMQVVDLTSLRGKVSLTTLTADVEYREFGNAHNVIANEETGFLYVVGSNSCNGGLHFIDVTEPLNPNFAGCFQNDGYTHDAECVVYHGPDEPYQDHEICFCFNEDTITVVDVTDKSSPVMISRKGYLGSAYVHQGSLTEDHTMLLADDELDEYNFADKHTKTYIWNVHSLENPWLSNTYTSSQTAIDHNMYVVGNLVYQSNYEAGLRILNIDQARSTLKEVAYFDVLPSSTRAAFHGSWSNYPYFPSGLIPVSSIDYGLYLVKPNRDKMAQVVAEDEDHAEEERFRRILWAGPEIGHCPPIVETRECVPEPC